MDDAYRTLLSLIAPLIGGRAGACAPVEDARLCHLAAHHSVTNLLYLARKDDPALPPNVREYLEGKLFRSAQIQLMQEREAARIFAALEAAGVRYLPMKGVVLRPFYPAPEMRVSCDVDIFYDKEKRVAVGEMMSSLGFAETGVDSNHTAYRRGQVSVEMHHNLLTDQPTVDRYYADAFSRLLPDGGCRYRMRDEDFYIYGTVHAMKHFVVAGIGIRPVMDVFVFRRTHPDMDRAYLTAELGKLGLLSFHTALETLADVYFDARPMPPELEAVSDYLLGSGTYGTAAQAAANRLRGGGKMRLFFRRAFPPYRVMREKYPALRRFPPALPFFWCGRLFRAVFGKGGQAEKEVRAACASREEDGERLADVMRRVGLDGYR